MSSPNIPGSQGANNAQDLNNTLGQLQGKFPGLDTFFNSLHTDAENISSKSEEEARRYLDDFNAGRAEILAQREAVAQPSTSQAGPANNAVSTPVTSEARSELPIPNVQLSNIFRLFTSNVNQPLNQMPARQNVQEPDVRHTLPTYVNQQTPNQHNLAANNLHQSDCLRNFAPNNVPQLPSQLNSILANFATATQHGLTPNNLYQSDFLPNFTPNNVPQPSSQLGSILANFTTATAGHGLTPNNLYQSDSLRNFTPNNVPQSSSQLGSILGNFTTTTGHGLTPNNIYQSDSLRNITPNNVPQPSHLESTLANLTTASAVNQIPVTRNVSYPLPITYSDFGRLIGDQSTQGPKVIYNFIPCQCGKCSNSEITIERNPVSISKKGPNSPVDKNSRRVNFQLDQRESPIEDIRDNSPPPCTSRKTATKGKISAMKSNFGGNHEDSESPIEDSPDYSPPPCKSRRTATKERRNSRKSSLRGNYYEDSESPIEDSPDHSPPPCKSRRTATKERINSRKSSLRGNYYEDSESPIEDSPDHSPPPYMGRKTPERKSGNNKKSISKKNPKMESIYASDGTVVGIASKFDEKRRDFLEFKCNQCEIVMETREDVLTHFSENHPIGPSKRDSAKMKKMQEEHRTLRKRK